MPLPILCAAGATSRSLTREYRSVVDGWEYPSILVTTDGEDRREVCPIASMSAQPAGWMPNAARGVTWSSPSHRPRPTEIQLDRHESHDLSRENPRMSI